MPAAAVGTTWSLVTPDRAAVLAALARGECDGLLPAASEFLDGFAAFVSDIGILPLLDRFPDHRHRRSIVPAFFCNTLIHKALLRIDSLIFRTLTTGLQVRWCVRSSSGSAQVAFGVR